MKFLVAVEKFKSNILKIVIVFATITLYFSLFERFFYSHNRNQLNLTIDIYSMYNYVNIGVSLLLYSYQSFSLVAFVNLLKVIYLCLVTTLGKE